MKPVARRDGLLTRELKDELLVYARDEHRAHCLNRTAATVFRNADGTRSVADLARLLRPQMVPGAGEAVVEETLERLAEAGLLEGWSRREVVRRVGIGAAVLLPAIVSIVAPTPAEAAVTCVSDCSTAADGTPCSCTPGVDPCTATCVSNECSDGGGC